MTTWHLFLGWVAEGSQGCGRRLALQGKQHPRGVLACDPSRPSLALGGKRRYIPACCPHWPAVPAFLPSHSWQPGQPVPVLLQAVRGHLCIARSSVGTARPAAPSNRLGSDPSLGLSHERSRGPLSPRPGQGTGVTGRQGSSV